MLFTAIVGGLIFIIAVYLFFKPDDEEVGRRGEQGGFADGLPSLPPAKFAITGSTGKKSSEYVSTVKRILGVRGDLRVITVGLSLSVTAKSSSEERNVVNMLVEHFAVFLVVSVPTETEEESLRKSIHEAYPSVPKHRLLMHTTAIGGVAILRQLQPHVHVEYSRQMLNEVLPYMKNIVFVKNDTEECADLPSANGKVFTSQCLRDVFSM